MKNAMTKAWEIRKNAAKKFACNLMEIDFAECLRMAWIEIKEGSKMEGTEKNIAWAIKIKETKMAELKAEIETYGIDSIKETIDNETTLTLTIEQIEERIQRVENKNIAVWWINNKDLQYTDLALLITRVDDKLFDR